jgi:hypothetical protein
LSKGLGLNLAGDSNSRKLETERFGDAVIVRVDEDGFLEVRIVTRRVACATSRTRHGRRVETTNLGDESEDETTAH